MPAVCAAPWRRRRSSTLATCSTTRCSGARPSPPGRGLRRSARCAGRGARAGRNRPVLLVVLLAPAHRRPCPCPWRPCRGSCRRGCRGGCGMVTLLAAAVGLRVLVVGLLRKDFCFCSSEDFNSLLLTSTPCSRPVMDRPNHMSRPSTIVQLVELLLARRRKSASGRRPAFRGSAVACGACSMRRP